VGLLTGARADPASAAAEGRGLRIDSIYVGSAAHLKALVDASSRFGLKPVIDRSFEFAEARSAYEYLASGAHFGKIVVRV
jgi:NADPH:quinone reductase-like Zn-dependent oxidoreductase